MHQTRKHCSPAGFNAPILSSRSFRSGKRSLEIIIHCGNDIGGLGMAAPFRVLGSRSWSSWADGLWAPSLDIGPVVEETGRLREPEHAFPPPRMKSLAVKRSSGALCLLCFNNRDLEGESGWWQMCPCIEGRIEGNGASMGQGR